MKKFEEVMEDVNNLNREDKLKVKEEIDKAHNCLAENKVVIIDKPDEFMLLIDGVFIHAVTSYNVSHDNKSSDPKVTITFEAKSVDSIKK